MSNSTYVSERMSADGDAIVYQVVLPGPDPCRPPITCRLAALESRGAEFASEWIGALVLLVLTTLFKFCARYELKPSEAYIQEIMRRGAGINTGTLDAPPTRPEYLRLHARARPDRLLVDRELPTGTIPAASLLLASLSLSGTGNAARQVGRSVLDEMAALHPDLFVRYPRLAAPPQTLSSTSVRSSRLRASGPGAPRG